MRKVIVFLFIVLLAVVPAFAAENLGAGFAKGTVSKGNPLEASTKVSFDLEGNDSQSYVELYFLGSNDTSNPSTSPKTSVSLAFSGSSPVADNTADPLYAYWKIISGTSLDVKLEMRSDLVKEDTYANQTTADDGTAETGIKWTVSWADATEKVDMQETGTVENTSITSNGTTPVNHVIGNHPGTGMLQTGDLMKITITTAENAPYDQLTAGTYSAYLYLVCSAQS